jgi:hypothetical protein
MKSSVLIALLTLVAALASAEPVTQPSVRRLDGAAEATSKDQGLYLFVRYNGGQVEEMILANAVPANVEHDNGRTRVIFRTPAGARMSFGNNKGLTLVRIQADGRVRQTQNRLPELQDDPVIGFEKTSKDGDLQAYLASRGDTAPLLTFFTAPDEPVVPRPPAEPRRPASRPDAPADPTAELAEALRGGGRVLRRVQFILEKKPDLKATNKYGEPVIYQAVKKGDPDVVFELIKAGADPNAKTTGGDMAIHLAVQANNTGTARVLLENGADPNAAKGNGWTPLGMAAFDSQYQMVRLLLAFKADPKLVCRDKLPIDWAKMQPGNDDVVNALSAPAK